MAPKLKKIDLSKIVECEHPDIKVGKSYRAKIEGDWYVGKFTRQWYGLNFDGGFYDAGHQLDYGDIEELYEIVEKKERGGKTKNVGRKRRN